MLHDQALSDELFETVEDKSYAEFSAYAVNFKLDFTATIVTNGLLGDMKEEKLDQIQEMLEDISGLRETSKDLTEADAKLRDGMEEFGGGIDSLSAGAYQLSAGAAQLATGLDSLSSGAQSLSWGTYELSEGFDELTSGLLDYLDGVSEFSDELLVNLADLADGPMQETLGALYAAHQADGAYRLEGYEEADQVTFILETGKIR
ncbi:MAG: hypothetical protein J6P72_04660 [Firmicutes bacterium]|nr:hypothetical protein [Bacillota bacterium]